MGASGALVLERLLGDGFRSKPASLALLSTAGAKLYVASALPARETSAAALPIGLDAIDRLLDGGLPRGRLTELVGRRSSARFSIVLAALASATGSGEAAALVDRGGHFDPNAALAAGVELERILWTRPRRVKDALAAAEMLLAAGFPLVALDLGLPPLRGAAPESAWVRLSRAAELERAALLLSTPYRLSGFAAGTVVRAGVGAPLWESGGAASPRLLGGASTAISLERNLHGAARRREALLLRVAEAVPGESSSPRRAEDRRRRVESSVA